MCDGGVYSENILCIIAQNINVKQYNKIAKELTQFKTIADENKRILKVKDASFKNNV